MTISGSGNGTQRQAGHDGIGVSDKPEQRFEILHAGAIEHQAPFAGVQECMEDAAGLVTQRVAAGRLDAHDVVTQLSQQPRSVRADVARKVQHARH
jgi:hypothetical protein